MLLTLLEIRRWYLNVRVLENLVAHAKQHPVLAWGTENRVGLPRPRLPIGKKTCVIPLESTSNHRRTNSLEDLSGAVRLGENSIPWFEN